jgi:hypothetical protein
MGFSDECFSSYDFVKRYSSALEAIWNKIDEKKQNQPYHKRLQPLKKDGLEGWLQ